MAPSRTITGQSIASQRSEIGTSRSTAIARLAATKAIAAGSSPVAVTTTAAPSSTMGRKMRAGAPMRSFRSA
ncbi:MAG: hypothetical protein M5U09_13300, partial [Gammaproteobacteria bacterium]|nr:hypothetical protein [Gammaproteobacteria bacterium]